MAALRRARSVRSMEECLKSVSDVMRAGVVSVAHSISLDAVARAMREHGVHGVLVVGDDAEILGWVTARGVLRHGPAQWRHVKAGEAVDEPCVGVVPSASVTSAIGTLLDSDATRLAVIRPGSRVPDGVVSEVDLVAHLSR